MADVNGANGAYHTDALAEVTQSLRDRLLTTPGTRLLRPTYGSALPAISERNFDRAAIDGAVTIAATQESHRFALTGIDITPSEFGDVDVQIYGNEVTA